MLRSDGLNHVTSISFINVQSLFCLDNRFLVVITRYEQNASYTFLACLALLIGLPHFCLMVDLIVSLTIDGAEYRGGDVAVGFSR